MLGDQHRHHRCRDGDAETDAAKMPRLQVATAGGIDMAEDDAGHEDHDEGAGQAGQKADDEKGDHGVGQSHQGGQDRAGAKSCQHQQPLAAMRPTARRSKRADEVAEIVGGGDPPGIGRRQMQFFHHAGQDRRVDEAADAHGDGHRNHAGESETQRG